MNSTASVVQATHPSREQTAPKAPTVPTELSRLVQVRGDDLVVFGRTLPAVTVVPHVALQIPWLIFGTLLGILVIAFGAEFALIPALLAGFALVLGTLGASFVAIIAHVLWFAVGTSVGFGPRGYRTRLPMLPYRKTRRLVLRGDVGEPLQIVGEHGKVFEQKARVNGPWQVAHIFWFAHQLAGRMGVRLEIETDTQAWNRWAVDPAYRAQVEFEGRVRRSYERYGAWYRIPAQEPGRARFEPEGVRWSEIWIEHRGLRARRFGVAWAHVYDAEIELYEYTWVDHNSTPHQETRARLLVRTHEGVKSLLARTANPRSVAELFWARDQIRQNAGRYIEGGTAADVPQELLAARDL